MAANFEGSDHEGVTASPRKDLHVQIDPDLPVSLSSPLSPKSPSSVFTKTTIECENNCILNALLFSQWDNIIGPKIRHLWSIGSQKPLPREVLNYVSGHTVSGEICRDPLEGNVDSKLYVLKEKNIIVHAFIFGAMGPCDLAVHSMALIMPHAEMKTYMTLYDLVVGSMKRLMCKLRILLEKVLYNL